METCTSEYDRILRDLVTNSADIEGAAILTPYGVQIAANMPGISNAKFLSTAVASAVSLATSLIVGGGKGYLKQFSLKVAHGFLVAMTLLDGSILIALCREQAKLGLVFLDMGRAGNRVGAPTAGSQA